MADEQLISQTIQLEKILNKLKIKKTQTVLITQSGSFRTELRRTDFLSQKLTEDDYLKIGSLFQSTLALEIKNLDTLFNLFTVLSKKGLMLRLDRVPQVVKGSLKKWPEKMHLAPVN